MTRAPALEQVRAVCPPRARRRATTLVETLVAGSIGMVLIGALMHLWTTGAKLDAAAGSTAALQAAALLETALVEDLRQLAQAPDSREVLHISDDKLAFHAARMRGAALHLHPVSWKRVPDGPGQFRLARTERDESRASTRLLPQAPLGAAHFAVLESRQTHNRFVRLTFTLSGERPPLVHTVLVGLRDTMGPNQSAFAPAVQLVVDGALD